jgi:hypothetical protein
MFQQHYGNIAKIILKILGRSDAAEIRLIFDTYKLQSIKEVERSNRGQENLRHNTYEINGPNQQRTIEFSKLLQSDTFKTSLVDFLSKHFESDEFCSIIGKKKIFVTNNEKCFSFESINSKIQRKEEQLLRCSHEEADSKIFFHISSMTDKKKIVVKANDTDVLVIALTNQHKYIFNHEVWIETGSVLKNSHRFVNVKLICR